MTEYPFTVTREDWEKAEGQCPVNGGTQTKNRKYSGEGNHTCFCVVAEAFKRQFPGEEIVTVTFWAVRTAERRYRYSLTDQDKMESMISAFDNGRSFPGEITSTLIEGRV